MEHPIDTYIKNVIINRAMQSFVEREDKKFKVNERRRRTIMDGTIYHKKQNLYPVDPYQMYASEARTIENLLSMGFTNTNGKSLADRLKVLEDEIKRIEDLRKKSGRRR